VSSAADGVLFEKSKENFDLILLDWMLPKMTGLELCKAIRLKNNTTLFFLTAKDTVQETIEGLKAGANDYKKNLLVLMNY
jgi:DNA-binding response OmpR family regulator